MRSLLNIIIFLLFICKCSFSVSGREITDFSSLKKGTNVVTKVIDLHFKSVLVPKGVSIVFHPNAGVKNGTLVTEGALSIKGGIIEDVSIIANGALKMKMCHIAGPNINVAVYRPPLQNKYEKIRIIDCVFENIGEKVGLQQNSIAAVYLQDVDDVLIKNCKFIEIGNKETTNTSAIFIGTAATEARYCKRKPNGYIKITGSTFNNVKTSPSFRYNTGEEHFIVALACKNVIITHNFFCNNSNPFSYDNEYIYTKSGVVFISNNVIRGECGGEGFICCKPYRFADEVFMTQADIINNDINVAGYTICTHYGVGRIYNNKLFNSCTGFIVGIKKTVKHNDPDERDFRKYDVLQIAKNNVQSICTIKDITTYTSTQRAAIHMDCASNESCNTFVKFENNNVRIDGSLFSSFLNLRDFRYSYFKCTKNSFINDGNQQLRLVSFDIVDRSLNEREFAVFEEENNTFNGFYALVYIPSNSLKKDSLKISSDLSLPIIDNRK